MHKLLLGFLFAVSVCSFAEPASFLNVPLVRQSTDYSCGPAALLGVIAYYGNVDHNETDLMKLAQTNTDGTDLILLTQASNKVGVKARWKDEATLDEIQQSLDKGHPVIVEAQAWFDKPPSIPMSDIWDEGHFLVVVAIDDKKIYFMDPSHMGSRGYWTKADFLERWHDISAGNKKRHHTAMFFEGTPNPPKEFLPIP